MVQRQSPTARQLIALRPVAGLVSGQRGPANVPSRGIRPVPTGLSGLARAAVAGAKAHQEGATDEVNERFLALAPQFAEAFDDPEALAAATKKLSQVLRENPDVSPLDLAPAVVSMLRDIGGSAYGQAVAKARQRYLEALQPARLLNEDGTALRLTPQQIRSLPSQILQEELQNIPEETRALLQDPLVGPILGGEAIRRLRSYTEDEGLRAAEAQAIQQANSLVIQNKAGQAAQSLLTQHIASVSNPGRQEESSEALRLELRNNIQTRLRELVDDARDHALPRNAQLEAAVSGFISSITAVGYLDYEAALTVLEELGEVKVPGFGKALEQVPLVANQIFLAQAKLAQRAESERDRDIQTARREDEEFARNLETQLSTFVLSQREQGISVDAALEAALEHPEFEELRKNPLFSKAYLEASSFIRRTAEQTSDPEAYVAINDAISRLDTQGAEALLSVAQDNLSVADFAKFRAQLNRIRSVQGKLAQIPEYRDAVTTITSQSQGVISRDPGLEESVTQLQEEILGSITDFAATADRDQISQFVQEQKNAFTQRLLDLRTQRNESVAKEAARLEALAVRRDPVGLQEIRNYLDNNPVSQQVASSLRSRALALEQALEQSIPQVVDQALDSIGPILEDQGLDPGSPASAIALRKLRRRAEVFARDEIYRPGDKINLSPIVDAVGKKLLNEFRNLDSELYTAVDDAQKLIRLSDEDAIVEELYPAASPDRVVRSLRKRIDNTALFRPSAFVLGFHLGQSGNKEELLSKVGVPLGALKSGQLRPIPRNSPEHFRTGGTADAIPVDPEKLDLFTPIILSDRPVYSDAIRRAETSDARIYTKMLDEAADILNIPIELRSVWKSYQLAWNKAVN